MERDQGKTNLSNLQVLVIDDDLEVVRLIESVLEGMGITKIHRATDGEEALTLFQSSTGQRLDLVICDWSMPKLSGLDLLREIRSKNSGIPFLMVTGKATEDAVLAAKEHGASAYVTKPFSIDAMERKVRALIKRKGLS